MAKTKETLNYKLFNESKKYLVGGVNSPVRAFRQVGGEPIFIKSACGSKIYSEDGREFIDYCQSFGT
ncbi:MAG: aspartate aminotransferase family protein, partial [Candidatus Omnitrophota bacterium]|nr:aspartate aminotransferase family protein [Candidatus Omnitrophota bacterium]